MAKDISNDIGYSAPIHATNSLNMIAHADEVILDAYDNKTETGEITSTDNVVTAFKKLNNKIATAAGNYTINGKPISSNPTLTKDDIGLDKIDNTSDADKPISTATLLALDKKHGYIYIVKAAGAVLIYFYPSYESALANLNSPSDQAALPNASSKNAGIITAKQYLNLLTDDEKGWIEDQLFTKLFTCVISANPASVTFNGADVNVTFTLLTKYSGNLVDLDSVPEGWTKTATGTYTKVTTITSATGASVSLSSVSCTYNKRSKTSNNSAVTNIKDSYIYYSTDATLTKFPTKDLIQLNSNNTVSGTKTLTIKTDKVYVYFIISNTSRLNNVQQLGQNFLLSTTGTSLTRDGYGTYTVFRSLNAMAIGTQTVVVS